MRFKKATLFFIDMIKEFKDNLFPSTCRLYPSCSDYAKKAVLKYGVLKGLIKGSLRIFRCHPLRGNFYDPLK